MKLVRWSAAVLLGVMVLCGVFAPSLAPHPVAFIELESEFAAPSAKHWLGQGENGLDLFSHILFGLRNSLAIVIGVCLAGMVIGVVVALLMLLGGWPDRLFMRVVDLVQAFPGMILNLALAVFLGAGVWQLGLALVATSWASYARVLRGEGIRIKELDHVAAARALGVSQIRLWVRHVLPFLWPTAAVQMGASFGSLILVEASLSFLGLGLPSDTPSLGRLIAQGREGMAFASHTIIVPAVVLFLVVLCVNIMADAIRDWLDPKFQR